MPTHSLSSHALSLSEAHSFREAAFSAAGTDETMRRYNILASLRSPFRGVRSPLLAEAQLGRKQDNWDGNRLACVPGWITYTVQCAQYGCCKCSGFRKKYQLGCRGNIKYIIFQWQELICWKCFHLSSVTPSCNSLFDASLISRGSTPLRAHWNLSRCQRVPGASQRSSGGSSEAMICAGGQYTAGSARTLEDINYVVVHTQLCRLDWQISSTGMTWFCVCWQICT